DARRHGAKVGLGQIVLRGREYLVALKPSGNGLLLETLRFADEVRNANASFSDIGAARPDKELLELAEELIDRKTTPFDPKVFHDKYTEALRELIEAKAKHKTIEVIE